MIRLLETAPVAVLAVQRFGGEWLRCGALATALGRSMTAGTNCSNLLQSMAGDRDLDLAKATIRPRSGRRAATR